MRVRRPLARLAGDRRGVTALEFGIVAPVLMMLLLGIFDTAHTLYMKAILQGVVQKTARDSALQTGTAASAQLALDNKVRASVSAIANNATIAITRRYYRSFAKAAAAAAESFTDTNVNGKCDAGEPFQDDNNNGVWDPDGGDAGQGTAKDRTVYTVAVSYPRFFPIWKMIGGSNVTQMSATTVLENQPYSDQGSYAAATVGKCP